MSLLSIRDVKISFSGNVVVKGVSFDVEPNEIVALIGPSGCGKSTLLRSLNRMHDETSTARVEGEVLLKGSNIYGANVDPVEVRAQIGMVFQKPNPFPGLSIWENAVAGPLLMGGRKKAELKDLAEVALKQAALWDEVKDKLNQPGTSLSGGQQQRLCIARTLAVQPALILMDEPTSALDPISTARIEELLAELKKTQTIVIVTHNLQQAARVSDKTGFMFMGNMIEFGATGEMFTKPRQAQTESYITGRFG